MTHPHQRIQVLSAGILSLILMLGIARFAYTPLLPLMQQQAGLGVAEAGWLASINYIGYLLGASIASLISNLVLKDRLYRIGLIVAVISTVGMGFTDNLWLWSLSRFFAGLSSAAGLLLGSGLILNWLLRHNHRSELGIHFSGIGLGIAFSALAIELMNPLPWDQQWLLLSLAGVILMIPAWRWLPPPDSSTTTQNGATLVDCPPSRTYLYLFMAAYFCAGVGYVVSATFIVAIIDQIPALSGNGSWTFLLLGLGAAPACIIWDLIARRSGELNALIAAFLLQIISILLPVLLPTWVGAVISALLFGSTFVGIVSLVLTMAGRYYPTRPAKMMGKMTITYGVAQIAAPAITGLLAQQSGNYNDGLYLAAGMMVLGTLLMLQLKRLERTSAA
ncbi:MAG: YbfB/YjiJ family MFS transporter [Gammaproteobacteria bacterium]|jgi:predicted MFS family arabinose efflux permease|nr:YbfB/YjiJ family MFS transporter [Gammaproteobacteria bacterium]MBT4605361.1 YbfB/YjiJ family MFS transporter [Thiotrichales bacterium]MBT3968119.1 YbfB/YjiJ family MFS transporter [Gammaproteobacteria bacterium]MBT4081185.1 YbfB/YjiJ family MFS transporter [Gammaproteobacteria bacterium]MBT4331304.1 YbfB/YjiJ family MFS transporter [Gammaproteobacteria bacterium]